jgi:hypothetical protein
LKLRANFLSVLAISSTVALTNCSGGGTHYSYEDVTVTVSPQVPSVQVNATQTFTATVTNSPPITSWLIQQSSLTPVGTFTTATEDAPTGTYTAPAAPPIYGANEMANGAVQGSVTLSAYASSSLGSFDFVSGSVTFVITGPISVGLSPTSASLNLGGTQQFTGYAVGSTNTALIWQVNGVTGGGTATGIITTAGLYTAPMTIPMTGNTVTITAVSQADPTKTASSVVTLTSP